MKKAFANTRVAVKLRKSEHHEEWYLYLEAYPVFELAMPVPLLTGRRVISPKGI